MPEEKSILAVDTRTLGFLGMRRRTSTQGDTPHNSVTHEETGTVIKTLTKAKPAKDAYHLLDRWEEVTLIRLRTGHNRLNTHM